MTAVADATDLDAAPVPDSLNSTGSLSSDRSLSETAPTAHGEGHGESEGEDTPAASDTSPAAGTRKRLDHIDAMRPIKQAGVVGTHTLLAFAPVAATVAAGASLMLLHVTREAFLFVSACMLTYSYRQSKRIDRSYWSRRFLSVGVPYLCWTLIYFLFLLPSTYESPATSLGHLGYLFATGYYQLYYLIVVAQFYVVFPLLLLLVRRTSGHHRALLAISGAIQILVVGLMHWNVPAAQHAGVLGHPRDHVVPVLFDRRHGDRLPPRRGPRLAVPPCAPHHRVHRGQCGSGRGLVLPVCRQRGRVAGIELGPVPADRHPLQHRSHRLHLPAAGRVCAPWSTGAAPVGSRPWSIRARTMPTASTWPR